MNEGFQTSKRPLMLWVVSIFYILVAVGTLAFCDLAFAASNLPPAYLVTVAATALLTLIAALALVLLQRQAPLLFILALIAALVMYAWPFFRPAAFGAPTFGRGASTVVGISLMIAALFYSRSLKRKGVLK